MTTLHGVDSPLDEPFYAFGAISDRDDLSLPVSIDGIAFQIDEDRTWPAEPMTRRSVQLLNTQQAQSGGDISQTAPEVWRRSLETFHMGAGQHRYDREDSLPYRYHQSVGIDPWTKFGFSLLNETTSLLALASGHTALLVSIGPSLFVGTDTTVKFYATTGTAAVDHTSPATIIAMTTDGENLYVLSNGGVVEKRDSAGAWTTFYTVPATFNPAKAMLAFVKGFLLVSSGPILRDITTPASAYIVYTHPLSSWWWRAASDGLSVIYVLGGAGDRWHVHGVGIASTAATLNPPIVAATLPDGETAFALGTYLGYVLIGTHLGWRFGMPDSSGQITYGQVISTPGPVLCFEGQDRFVWFGMSLLAGQTPEVLAATVAGLGRADLATFVAPMTPAAASDLQASALGVVRSVVTVGGDLDGIGKRVFSVDGVGIFVEGTNLVSEGYLSTGGMSFNSTDQKMGVYLQEFNDPLVGGDIEVQISNDLVSSGAFSVLGHNDRHTTTSMGNIAYAKPFNIAEIKIRLIRDAVPTVGPRVTRIEFRALDVPGRATEFRVPLLVTEDSIDVGRNKVRSARADFDFLMELVQTRRQFVYREGDRTWNLHATDFVWWPTHLTSDDLAYNGTFMLTARELT